MRNKESGFITIEATVALTTFLFCILGLLMLINVCRAQVAIGNALNNAAKEASQYSYIYGILGLNDIDPKIGKEAEIVNVKVKGAQHTFGEMTNTIESIYGYSNTLSKDIGNTITKDPKVQLDEQIMSGVQVYQTSELLVDQSKNLVEEVSVLTDQVKDIINSDPLQLMMAVGKSLREDALVPAVSKALVYKHLKKSNEDANAYLERLGVVNGIGGLNFYGSEICTNGNEEIRLVVHYKVELKFFPNDVAVPFYQQAVTYGWFRNDDDN